MARHPPWRERSTVDRADGIKSARSDKKNIDSIYGANEKSADSAAPTTLDLYHGHLACKTSQETSMAKIGLWSSLGRRSEETVRM